MMDTVIFSAPSPRIAADASQAGPVAQQSVPVAETHVRPSPLLNIDMVELLKLLLRQIASPDKAGSVEDIRATLSEYGLDSSAGDYENSRIQQALQRLSKVKADTQTASAGVEELIAAQKQQVKAAQSALEAVSYELLIRRSKADFSASQVAATRTGAPKQTSENGEEEISVNTSYADLWKKIAEAIGKLKTEYVDFYAGLMKIYVDMYEAYNKYVQKAASSAVSTGDDGNNVTFDGKVMEEGYAAFKTEVERLEGKLKELFENFKDKVTPELEATLAPAFKVDKKENGEGILRFNLDQYHAMPPYPAGIIGGSKGKVSTASYQAWLASFNASGSAMQSNMQSFAQRYSQANSTFDNLNKVLSAAISTMADSARDVLRSL